MNDSHKRVSQMFDKMSLYISNKKMKINILHLMFYGS